MDYDSIYVQNIFIKKKLSIFTFTPSPRRCRPKKEYVFKKRTSKKYFFKGYTSLFQR